MKRNDSTMPLEYQIDLIEAKGKRAMSKLLITGPLAIAGLLFAFIISIFDDDVFWMALIMFSLPLLINILYIVLCLGQFTRNYTQTVKRAADNKRRYAPGWVHSTCLLRGFPKGAAPHLAHDFAEQSVVCYTLCRRCPENTVAAGEGKGI